MVKYQLKEVFTPGGMPDVTYVGREHLELEKKIQRAVQRGYAINVVTGPTKSGKSVLCHRVLGQSKLVAVEGGQIRSEDELWEHVAHQLRVADTESESHSDTATVSAGWNLGALLGLNVGAEAGTQVASAKSYRNQLKLACIQALSANAATLLVDDFHYLSKKMQLEVIQSLKGPVMKGLCVFLLAVPHRAFDPMTVEAEIEGRFKHIEIPMWSIDDLLLIPQQGFPAMNLETTNSLKRKICEEAFGNPLLVQEVCSELCLENDITETQLPARKLTDSLLDNAFIEIAESKGFPKYQKLKKGPQARKARKQRLLQEGEKEDIYAVLMRAIADSGPKAVTLYDEIRTSLRKVLHKEENLPQKNEVTSALSHMSEIARRDIEGEPPLEWVKDDNELVITDPFLLFYMKYAFREKIAKI